MALNTFTRTWLRYVRVFAVVIPSVCLTSVVCLSVVCNVGAPYSGGWTFRQNFFTAAYAGHPLTSVQNFTEIVYRGTPPSGALNARGVSKYQGCRGYEISHPYPYPYPQIFCGYPWISISMDIHGYPYSQTYPLYRLYVSTNSHKGHSSESTVGILVFCTSI